MSLDPVGPRTHLPSHADPVPGSVCPRGRCFHRNCPHCAVPLGYAQLLPRAGGHRAALKGGLVGEFSWGRSWVWTEPRKAGLGSPPPCSHLPTRSIGSHRGHSWPRCDCQAPCGTGPPTPLRSVLLEPGCSVQPIPKEGTMRDHCI